MQLQRLEEEQQEKIEKHRDIIYRRQTNAKEYTDHILERLELLKVVDIVHKIETEHRYLDKVDKIQKIRTDKEVKDKEDMDKLRSIHVKWFNKAMRNKEMISQEETKNMKIKDKKFRLSQESLQFKQEEQMYKSQIEKEKEWEEKKKIVLKNLEKEKKKQEWKKMKVLNKEKQAEDRLQYIKLEEFTIKKSLAELTIQQHLEKERLAKTMRIVAKNNDFRDMKMKEFIQMNVPDIEISHIFKQKEEKKKDDENM